MKKSLKAGNSEESTATISSATLRSLSPWRVHPWGAPGCSGGKFYDLGVPSITVIHTSSSLFQQHCAILTTSTLVPTTRTGGSMYVLSQGFPAVAFKAIFWGASILDSSSVISQGLSTWGSDPLYVPPPNFKETGFLKFTLTYFTLSQDKEFFYSNFLPGS